MSVCLYVCLSLNDVQATILIRSSWFLDSRCIQVWEPWQNFFVKIGQVIFCCCHGNQSLNDERWGFFNILIFYFSAISRGIALKFLQDTYRVVIKSSKIIDLHRSKVKVTRTVHWFLKVQSYHKNWATENFQSFLVDTSLYALWNETIKTRASREMTSQKIRQYLTLTCKTPIPKLLSLIISSKQILKLWQSYSPVLLIFPMSVPNLVTIGRY